MLQRADLLHYKTKLVMGHDRLCSLEGKLEQWIIQGVMAEEGSFMEMMRFCRIGKNNRGIISVKASLSQAPLPLSASFQPYPDHSACPPTK